MTDNKISNKCKFQGIFNLNLFPFFSCYLIVEIACEEMYLCLDRPVLVDGEFGHFKDFI
jgi:hypothetical protein